MGDKSKIEWTNATWNPVTGCTKVSAGCRGCYAERHANRFWGDRNFTDVQMHADRLDQPLRWKKPRMIFVNSMSDLFHESVPDEFIINVFAVMARAKHHTFQILTKRAERMHNIFIKYGGVNSHTRDEYGKVIDVDQYEFPLSNVWLGVSCENQETADERIPWLARTPAAVRFVSAEPLIGQIKLPSWGDVVGLKQKDDPHALFVNINRGGEMNRLPIDWLIAGGESGPHARPCHPDWIRSLRDQCASANVPFFFKQWGEFIFGNEETMNAIGDDSFARKKWIGESIYIWDNYGISYRVGKRAAGNELDRKQHMQFPHARITP